MGDVSAAIRKYIKDEITLSQSDISTTCRSREWFLNRIDNVINNRSKEAVLYSPNKFIYFGSYFKGTKVKNVDEYDILVIIDSNTGMYSSGGTKVGNGLGTVYPNYKYSDRYYKTGTNSISPAKMLNWLKGIVEEVTNAFGGQAPIRNGQAITATIQSQNMAIDLVPAGIFNRESDGTMFYNIPKGDAGNNWIVTSPKYDIKLLSDVASGKSDFRNVVRIAKRIKETFNFQVSSFAIETIIVNYGRNSVWWGDLYIDLSGGLRSLIDAFRLGFIADPYTPTNNLIEDVTLSKWYADRLDNIIAILDACKLIDKQETVYDRVRKAFENE